MVSRVKRKLEQHLVQMKSHLWNFDSMRKTVKSKIAILSRALELDAQRMKVWQFVQHVMHRPYKPCALPGE